MPSDSERRLLIAHNGADGGRDALVLGSLLAAVLAAKPLVVTVLKVRDRLALREQVEAVVAQEAEPRLEEAGRLLEGFEVETRALADDSPARALSSVLEDEVPIAAVVGSPHRGTLGRIVLGSVAEALLAGAPAAIAVAPAGYADREERRLRRLGVAVDGSDESRVALATAVAMAERLRASLLVLTALPPAVTGYGPAFEALSAGEYEGQRRREMERVLEDALASMPERLEVEGRLLEGDPASVIVEASSELDLLLIGSRGYGPVRRVILGGVARGVMRASPCPVLVLPRSAGPDPLTLADPR